MSHTLHQQLVQLRRRATAWLAKGHVPGFVPTYGICRHPKLHPDTSALLADLLASWPGGSGDRDYPVPHPAAGPQRAYDNTPPQEMWNPEFEYARNRWALLEWLIEQTASEADQ